MLFKNKSKKTSFNLGIYKWIIKLVISQKWVYVIGIFLLVVTNWLYTKMPLYFKDAIDIIQNVNQTQQLNPVLIEAVIVAFVIIFTRTLSRVSFFNPARKIEAEVKVELYSKLNRVPMEFFEKNTTGSLISKINNDIVYLRAIFGFGALQIFNILLLFTFAPYNMWRLSPQLTIYCLVPLIGIFMLLRTGIYYMRLYMEKRSKDLQNISNFSLSILNGIDVVKDYMAEKWAVSEFDENKFKLLNSTMALIRWRVFTVSPLLINLEEIQKIIIFIFAAISLANVTSDTNISVGTLVAFLGYISLFAQPLGSIGWMLSLFKQSTVAFINLYNIKIVEDRKSIKNPQIPKDVLINNFNKGITINNLTYCYPGTTEPVIDNISFSIKKGQIIGVLGEIGSGKSTLVDCLNKYLDVKPNMIKLGDIDIVELNEDEWRQIVLTVSQKSHYFSTTIKENILFSNPKQDISDEDLREIIKNVALDQEINQFPNKENEVIGEKGVTLSGGQKQRISIARSFVNKTKLLILDNVLSAVDSHTEKYLIDQFLSKKIAESLLIISHRTNAFKLADWIIVLKKGRIVEQGTPKQLYDLGGVYYKTWQLQK